MAYALGPTSRLLPVLVNPALASELAESNLTTAVASAELHDARNGIGANPAMLGPEVTWLLPSLVEPLMDLNILTQSRGIRFLRACRSLQADPRELIEAATIAIDSLRESLWRAEQCRLLKNH